MKSVIIAFSNPLLTNWMTSALNRGGYTIEYSCKTAGEVARVADFCTSPVVVSGFQFTDMTAEDLVDLLEDRLTMVTVLLPHQRDLIERKDMITLPYPLTSGELLQAIRQAEKSAAKQAVITGAPVKDTGFRPMERPAEEKLVIIKAKAILIDKFQMTESQAHRFLQKSSMDRGLKLMDAAKMVIENMLV